MKKFLNGLFHIFAEMLVAFPSIYIFAGITQGDTPMKYWLLAEMAVIMITALALCTLFDNIVLQIALGFVCCYGEFYLIGSSFGVFPNAYIIPGLIVPLLFWRGKQQAEYGWDEILPSTIVMVILAANLIIAGMTNVMGGMEQYSLLINIVGPFSFAAAIIVMNRINLRDLSEEINSHTRANTTTIASDMDVVNNVLMVLLVIAGFILSFGAVLRRIVQFIAKWVGVAMRFLYKILFEFDTTIPNDGAPSGSVVDENALGAMVIKDGNMGIWAVVLDVLSYIFVAVVCAFFLWLFWKGFKRIGKFLMGVFDKFAADSGTKGGASSRSYEDKREFSVNLADLPKKYVQEAKNKLGELLTREPKWTDFKTSGEKVRYLYKTAVKRSIRAGYTHNAGYTPEEVMKKASEHYLTLPEFSDELVREYEMVRYGEKEPIENQVETLKNSMKV